MTNTPLKLGGTIGTLSLDYKQPKSGRKPFGKDINNLINHPNKANLYVFSDSLLLNEKIFQFNMLYPNIIYID